MVTTDTFAIAPTAYAKQAISRAFTRRWWLIAIPVTLSAALSFSDIRFLLVTLMIIFIVTPLATAFVYLSELLTPRAVRAMHPHRVVIIPGESIDIQYVESAEFDTTPADEHIEWSDISSTHISHGYITFEHGKQFMPIPLNAIPPEKVGEIYHFADHQYCDNS